MKNNKKIVIVILMVLVCIMAVGYSLLSQNLIITGTSSIDSTWNIRITDISAFVSGTAEDKELTTGCTTATASSGGCNGTNANFSVGLITPGDYVLYTVTITNTGTLDGTVSSIDVDTGDNLAITYITNGLKVGDKIVANGGTNTITIKVKYNSTTTTQPSNTLNDIALTVNYVQDLGQVEKTAFTGTLYRRNEMMAYVGTLVDGNGFCTTVKYNGIPLKYCASTQEVCEHLLSVASSQDSRLDVSESVCTSGSITLQESLLTTYKSGEQDEIGYNNYLKHTIQNGVLMESYSCFVVNNIEYCMKGGDPTVYSANVGILQGLENVFNTNGGFCNINPSFESSDCSGVGFDIIRTSSDGVANSVFSGITCISDNFGNSYCRDY